MRKIALVNRYYPPNPGIAGEAACDLVEYLVRALPDISITAIHIDAPYLFKGMSPKKPAGTTISINTFLGRSQNIPVRFVRNLVEGYRLTKTALEDADVIISMTDPPLLNYWAGRMAVRNKIPWIYWAVDLYPHAYQAAALADEHNMFFRHLMKSFRKHAPSLLIALGEAQARFLQSHWEVQVPQVILPCGLQNETRKHQKPSWRTDESKIYFAYAGNLAEPHDPDFLVNFINCLDENKHRCILALYGVRAEAAMKAVAKHPAVEIVKKISRDELAYLDVHLVSLLPEWTHISVPSKAVSAICAGQTLLFNGSEDADTWRMFKEAAWHVPSSGTPSKQRERIKDILQEISAATILDAKKGKARIIKQRLFHMESLAYKAIADRIRNSAH